MNHYSVKIHLGYSSGHKLTLNGKKMSQLKLRNKDTMEYRCSSFQIHGDYNNMNMKTHSSRPRATHQCITSGKSQCLPVWHDHSHIETTQKGTKA